MLVCTQVFSDKFRICLPTWQSLIAYTKVGLHSWSSVRGTACFSLPFLFNFICWLEVYFSFRDHFCQEWVCLKKYGKLMHTTVFSLQIHYDLGAYHYLKERFEDAYSHFSEAHKLMSELGPQPEYCQVNIDKLKGYYNSCASLCGRSTPVDKRSLYDRFLYTRDTGYQVRVAPLLSCPLSSIYRGY